MPTLLAIHDRPVEDDPVITSAMRIGDWTGAEVHRISRNGASPEGILDLIRMKEVNLVVLRPRMPAPLTGIEHDPLAARIVLASPAALLILLDTAIEVPRRILVPVRPAALGLGTLRGAIAWAQLLSSPDHRVDMRPKVEVQVLLIAADPDEMYAALADLRGELEHAARAAPELDVQVARCVRWGAAPHVRALRWITKHGTDLVILGPLDAGVGEGIDPSRLLLLGAARVPVLVQSPNGNLRPPPIGVGTPGFESAHDRDLERPPLIA